MLIDLRTAAEKRRRPHPSDVEIEVPVPPISSAQLQWLENTLLYIAGANPRATTFKVFCAKGKRSKIAADILRRAGYDVVDLGGVG